MKRLLSTSISLLAVVGMLGAPVPASAGVAPSNDLIGDATAIGALPYTDTIDTRLALADGPRGCAGNRRSVYYRFRPPTTMRLQAATLGSNYDTVLSVMRGPLADLRRVTCSDDAFGVQSLTKFRAEAGVRYIFQVSSCCGGAGARGGDLSFSLQALPLASLVVDVVATGGTIDDVSGDVAIEGTLDCSNASGMMFEGSLRQRRNDLYVARTYISGTSPCSGPGSWTIETSGGNDISFAPGDARLDFTAWVFDGSHTELIEETQVITLST
jgi:hypothetical protein